MPAGIEYTPELATQICNRIMAGDSVITITKDKNMPCENTFYNWIAKYDDLLGEYMRARAFQQHGAFDRMREIASDKTLDPADKRVMIDVEKFRIVKLAPKWYGDKIDVNHGAQPSFSVLLEELYQDRIDTNVPELELIEQVKETDSP